MHESELSTIPSIVDNPIPNALLITPLPHNRTGGEGAVQGRPVFRLRHFRRPLFINSKMLDCSELQLLVRRGSGRGPGQDSGTVGKRLLTRGSGRVHEPRAFAVSCRLQRPLDIYPALTWKWASCWVREGTFGGPHVGCGRREQHFPFGH